MAEANDDALIELARVPGKKWRVLAHDEDRHIELENQGQFDELVVDHWLHVEQMSEREWLIAVGHDPEIAVWIDVKKDGTVGLRLKVQGRSIGVVS